MASLEPMLETVTVQWNHNNYINTDKRILLETHLTKLTCLFLSKFTTSDQALSKATAAKHTKTLQTYSFIIKADNHLGYKVV